MAKIGVSLGVTLHIGPPDNNEYYRMFLTLDEIDTERPLNEQLEQAGQAMRASFDWLENGLNAKIDEALKRKVS